MHQFHTIKKSIPGIRILLICRTLCKSQRLIKSAGYHSVKDRTESAAFRIICMGEEHRIGSSVPYLFRPYINILFIGIDIKEQLRRIQDLIYCLYGVLSPYDRKESNRVEYEKERTGNPEKIPHHKICSPCCLKLGQTVKYIEGFLSFLLDHVMNIYCKVFKPVGKGNSDCFYLIAILYEWLVACKPEINDIAVIFLRLLYIWLHKQLKLRKLRDAPYNIITHPYVINSRIHF